MNQEKILAAKEQWDEFVNHLSDEDKKQLIAYQDQVNSMDLFTYYIKRDFIQFDKVINTLPKSFLFDDSIIQLVYSCYVERNLPEAALAYINEAVYYHDQEGLPSTVDFAGLRSKLMDQQLFDNLRKSLNSLRSVPPEQVPYILPTILNGQHQFKDFILGEIVAALKVIASKKKAIRTEKENFINDMLVATLRLRFPLWGWEIGDQNRSGSSQSGKDAGEVDCTIRCAGDDLAIIEAFFC